LATQERALEPNDPVSEIAAIDIGRGQFGRSRGPARLFTAATSSGPRPFPATAWMHQELKRRGVTLQLPDLLLEFTHPAQELRPRPGQRDPVIEPPSRQDALKAMNDAGFLPAFSSRRLAPGRGWQRQTLLPSPATRW